MSNMTKETRTHRGIGDYPGVCTDVECWCHNEPGWGRPSINAPQTSNPASNDLVERLRGRVIPWHIGQASADEIERLQREYDKLLARDTSNLKLLIAAQAERDHLAAENAAMKHDIDRMTDTTTELATDNERLRAALKRAHEEADDHLEDLQLAGYHHKIWYPNAVRLVEHLKEALAGQSSPAETPEPISVKYEREIGKLRNQLREQHRHAMETLICMVRAAGGLQRVSFSTYARLHTDDQLAVDRDPATGDMVYRVIPAQETSGG